VQLGSAENESRGFALRQRLQDVDGGPAYGPDVPAGRFTDHQAYVGNRRSERHESTYEGIHFIGGGGWFGFDT
jgi:hypothetical protein